MRRKSWLRQASRDRRPRRTQSSISPSYGNNSVTMEGDKMFRRWVRRAKCVTEEQAETTKIKSKKTHPGSREKKKTREREEARG